MNKKIDYISFWRRDPLSVENIQQLKIIKSGKDFVKDDGSVFKDGNTLLRQLETVADIENTSKQYRAYLYEDDKSDFTLKFFLVVHFSDCTYLAVKGIHPFKQEHFKDIQNIFDQYL